MPISLLKLDFNEICIAAYHLYKGSCFRWIGDMWRAYVKVVLPQYEQLLIISHYTSIPNTQRIITEGRPRHVELWLESVNY